MHREIFRALHPTSRSTVNREVCAHATNTVFSQITLATHNSGILYFYPKTYNTYHHHDYFYRYEDYC